MYLYYIMSYLYGNTLFLLEPSQCPVAVDVGCLPTQQGVQYLQLVLGLYGIGRYFFKDFVRYPLVQGGCLRLRWACHPSSCRAKSKLYCGPCGHTASIFYGIWIKQSCAMGFILNLDKVLLKKLFPTMNI